LEDLFVINYRLQGLAEKKPETQETILAKRIKYRVRSIKEFWDGSGCEDLIDLGGFAGICKTHKKI
jgi:hypothetical protein